MSELQLMDIIKRLSEENKDLKNRVDVLEEILSNWLPIVGEKE
tara:strand:+ start:284 stop:412 length:129 start_codon:yes stop_codon:yes gene_type:complete